MEKCKVFFDIYVHTAETAVERQSGTKKGHKSY